MKRVKRVQNVQRVKRATTLAWFLLLAGSAAAPMACSESSVGGGSGGRGGLSGGGTGGGTGTGGGGAVTTAMDCPIHSSATGTFTMSGVCGNRGRVTATATTFDGYEELFIIGEDGLGKDVCVVRFDLKRVGDAPGGCADCLWSHLVEYSNPTIMLGGGEDGPCVKGQFGLTAAKLASITGCRTAVGFAKEYLGAHGSARMKYGAAAAKWDVAGNATWDESMSLFRYDERDGICSFQ